MTDYSALTPDVVIAAVESTGRWSDARILALNSYENRVYQVGIEDSSPLIAKFYRPARWSNPQIQEEHDFCHALVDAELPIVAPLRDEQQHSLFSYQGFRFALFSRQGGQAPEADNFDQLYRIGMLLGRVHALGQQQAFQHRPTLTIERYLTQPSQFILQHGFMPTALQDSYQHLLSQLQQHLQAIHFEQTVTIRCHGDCHRGNILWTRDDQAWLVDFDDCQMAPAVQDLWMLLTGSKQEQEQQLSELIEGYQQFCDFDRQQLTLISSLRCLRMVHYAGWLAQRWTDPAFIHYFPWFNSASYWQEHIRDLTEHIAQLAQEPLRIL